jgi:HPt (histidine-containing phosphotransfer) domain-containing protein
VNWTEALEGAAGDPELLQTVIDAYFEESEPLVVQLRDSLARGDAPGVKKAAHTLKGVLLAVGAQTTAQIALDLERLGTSGDLTTANARFTALEQQLQALASELRRGPR